MIRCGIAIYGMDPFHIDPAEHGLEPALELVSYVAEVKRARKGESAGYGRRFVAEQDTWIGTIPIGYGDGYRRGLTGRGDVLVGGRRVPLAGTVSMDNITVDLGDEPVERGTEAVLIGARGDERILAEDLGARAGHHQLRGDLRHHTTGPAHMSEALHARARGPGRRGGVAGRRRRARPAARARHRRHRPRDPRRPEAPRAPAGQGRRRGVVPAQRRVRRLARRRAASTPGTWTS